MEIDELIKLKLFKKALPKINKLFEQKDYYEYNKYKSIFYTAQSCHEEAISYIKEMRRHCNSPFEILEFYITFAKLQRAFHFNSKIENWLIKYSTDTVILKYFEDRLNEDETKLFSNLNVQYLELMIEINIHKNNSSQRDKNIEKLLNIAPDVIKLQYQLFRLDFEDLSNIEENLPNFVETFEQLIKNNVIPINRYLIISEMIGSHLIKLKKFEEAIFLLERAKDKTEKHLVDVRKLIIIRLIEVYHATKRMELAKEAGEDYGKNYLKAKKPILVNEYPIQRKLDNSNYLIKGENLYNEELDATNSIHIFPGELISIRGPKGSGKSTLLNYLLGLDHPDNGEIYFQNIKLGNLSVKEMTQFRNDNMCLLIEGRVLLPKVDAEHFKTIEFTNFTNSHPEEVRLAMYDVRNYMFDRNQDELLKFYFEFLAAIAKKPKLIFMNEPFANIHGEVLKKLFSVFRLLTKFYKFSIILETHHSISSDYTDCQYFFRDAKIVEIIERLP